MATDFENIVNVRLAVNDPPNIINILEVDDKDSLPASPVPQTAYYTTDTGYYWITDKAELVIAADWETADLFISDTQILTIITALGVDSAPCRILKLIARKLGAKIPLVKTTSGADSTEYVKLIDLYNYYEMLAAECSEINSADNNANTGNMYTMKQPEIGGGNL